MSKTFYAWAIDTKESGFIGRYWWFDSHSHLIPLHMEGCKLALFTTRKTARANLPSVRRQSFPNAKVVHVIVTVKEVI